MLHIVLYQPEIAANCGNIVRTCAAVGAALHLIRPLGFSLEEKAFVRAGMDYILDCDITEYDSLEDFCKRHEGERIFYITRYGEKTYEKLPLSDPEEDCYIMFGRESTGIPYELLSAHAEDCYRIPMRMHARSLNLSNCVAIVAYEAMRQQNFFDLSVREPFKGADFLTRAKKR